VCGSHALLPNLWATATLMASSDSLSPTAVIGGAWSHYYYYFKFIFGMHIHLQGHRSSMYMKVIGSRSRSHKKKHEMSSLHPRLTWEHDCTCSEGKSISVVQGSHTQKHSGCTCTSLYKVTSSHRVVCITIQWMVVAKKVSLVFW